MDISVIITVHKKRKRYLFQALSSVKSQKLNKKIETIIVADFESNYNDNEIKWVTVNNEGLGPKIAAGIEESHGDVIALLEDDDIWLPKKLAFVEETFKRIKGLSFLHHSYITTFDNLIPISKKLTNCYKRFFYDPIKREGQLKSLYPYCVTNNSSIAISREAAISAIDGLKKLNRASGVDRFIFMTAITEGIVLHEPKVLTLYRRPGLTSINAKDYRSIIEEGFKYSKWSIDASCGDLMAYLEALKVMRLRGFKNLAKFFEKYMLSSAISCYLSRSLILDAHYDELYGVAVRGLLKNISIGPASFLDSIMGISLALKIPKSLILMAEAIIHKPRY
ncbi:MAG: glycosyltransferase [Caldisphaera sp.]